MLTEDEYRLVLKEADFYEAPFTGNDLGICWKSLKIVYAEKANWAEVTHEIGHTFACLDNPEVANEWDFFGWEIALVKFLGLDLATWIESNKHYEVNEPGTKSTVSLGSLTHKQKEQVIEEALRDSTKAGLIDSKGQPLARRRGHPSGV